MLMGLSLFVLFAPATGGVRRQQQPEFAPVFLDHLFQVCLSMRECVVVCIVSLHHVRIHARQHLRIFACTCVCRAF